MADDGGFHQFCGNSSVFNVSLLLDSPWPQFTQCFQDSILVWVPCAWVWLSLPFYGIYLRYFYHRPPAPVNALNLLKTFCCAVLVLLSLVEVVRIEDDRQNRRGQVAAVLYVSVAIKSATFVLAGCLVQVERIKGVITSGVLWIFWFLLSIAGVVPFYSQIIQKMYQTELFQFVLFYTYYFVVLLEFLLHCFADTRHRHGYSVIGENSSPEECASFPSILTFSWINSLVLRAYRKDLQENDLFDLHPRDQSTRVVPAFQTEWEKEVSKAKVRNREFENSEAKHHFYMTFNKVGDNSKRHRQANGVSETSPLLHDDVTVKTGSQDKKSPEPKRLKASLTKALIKTYWVDLLECFACKLVYDLLQFVSPMLLNVLIAYTKNSSNEAAWKGYVYACSFFVVAVTSSVFYHQHFHISMTLGMRIRSACISAVYKKALTVNNEARKSVTVGEIVNLMSVDCQRLQDVTGYLYAIWSSPLQIVLALVLLWGQLGPPVLAGVAIMVLLIPLNAYLAVLQRRYQMQQMKLKDSRIKLMSEVLSGIKVLKLYAWEPSFEEKILNIRRKEFDVLKKSAYVQAFSTFTWTCAPFVVTLATFATYVLASDSHYLDAQRAFVSLSLFNILRLPINLLPMIISMMAQAQVSIVRIGDFLRNTDLDEKNVLHDPITDSAIIIKRGTFTWDKNLPLPTLRKINLEVPKGSLVAVVGQVGSGKSSLVSAILGEMDKLEGQVSVQSSIAYVPQQAWIQNATLRDNVLFGTRYSKSRYNDVLHACALKSDLDILPGGDLTEIGEKGINLSGGQKQRVSLARAVYSDADIYLLDDPLSAVDSHVGKHIFDKVIGHTGLLKHKTRVLVTHGVHWLPLVDTILVMTDGRISEMGSYDQLLSHDGDFAQFLTTYLSEIKQTDVEDPEILQMRTKILEKIDSVSSEPDIALTSGEESSLSERKRNLTRKVRLASLEQHQKGEETTSAKVEQVAKDKLIDEEKSETGKVKLSVFMTYFRAIGLGISTVVLLSYAGYQGLSVYSSIWLSQWTDDDILANMSLANTSSYQSRNFLYLGIYGGLGVGQAILVFIFSLLASVRMVTAASYLHAKMLYRILRSPMSFFDTTPSGRIINRFSSDVAVLDNTLPTTLRMAISQIFAVISTFVVISYSTPIFLTVVVPLGLLYYLVQKFYIPTSRQLKRLESTTRSPIFNHFSETITGVTCIRAYKSQERFMNENMRRVDKNIIFYFAGIASNRWLGFRLEFLGNLIVLASALFAVVTPGLEGGLVGLSVTYAMQVTGALNWMVRMASDLETNIVSVERLTEYSNIPIEGEWTIPDKRPSPNWPQYGAVQFHDYTTRYRAGLDLVLKGLNCDIPGGTKVGIVGRTGAGKSSMTLALFRLIEAASGNIVIDQRNIGDLGLHDLRSRITILPQDPVLFSGPLRMNLDPFDQYSDAQLWEALEHAHLKTFISETPKGLQYECGEGGANLSVGQRQLVCLARSLLRKSKILVLDEATAAVDMETDDLIQRTIRSEFKDCTVLTIAHRLNTVMDYDKILLMDHGVIKEFESPDKLLQNKASIFFDMAKDANLI